jgi:superfamily I DNA/RNA helicase
MNKKPHLKVLDTLNNIRFHVGTKLFIEVLLGEENARIIKLNLNRTKGFGCLELMTSKQVEDLLNVMKFNKLIEIQSLTSNKFIKVLKITNKGLNEMIMPQLSLTSKKGINKYFDNIEEVNTKDIENFKLLDTLLNGFNNYQKKAVISNSKRILCIAGAGSGKTSVLIKRIEYLVKYKSIEQDKILAITFTRKARQEMQERLSVIIPNHKVKIETFNSFSEKILRKYEKEIYGVKAKVLDIKLRTKLFLKVLEKLEIKPDEAINTYFSDKKIRSNDKNTLLFSLMNDIFAINDHYLNRHETYEQINKIINDFSYEDKKKARMIYKILKVIDRYKIKNNLRNYTEQIVHTIKFFKKNKEKIPEFSNILIDEYQDINDLQIELIDLLNPLNLFVVGDPRQSIYEWRNARIEHILSFNTKYPDASILQLRTNYRSTPDIINIANETIEPLKLPKLKSVNTDNKKSVILIKHQSDIAEEIFLMHSILAQDIPRNEIYILTRTNKQLDNIAEFLIKNKIKFLKKSSDLENSSRLPNKDEVVLSTVHAIKGLEAELVFVVGSNTINYPCKVSEHPVLELIKAEDNYNKENEELRLFYVALTRAKSKLVISYTGNITRFIPREYIERNYPEHLKNKSLKQFFKKDLYSELCEWRRETAKLYHVPAFQILSDRVLLQISKIKPKDFVELEAIPGMGPVKLNKFGDDLLEIVSA